MPGRSVGRRIEDRQYVGHVSQCRQPGDLPLEALPISKRSDGAVEDPDYHVGAVDKTAGEEQAAGRAG